MHKLRPPRPHRPIPYESGRSLADVEPRAVATAGTPASRYLGLHVGASTPAMELTAVGALSVPVAPTAKPSLPAAQENLHG